MRHGGQTKDGKKTVTPKPDPEINEAAKRRADGVAPKKRAYTPTTEGN